MDKKERNKSLQTLAASANGKALKDWLEEHIIDLGDVRKIDNDNFETDGRGRKHAIELLQSLFNTINIKIETSQRTKYN